METDTLGRAAEAFRAGRFAEAVELCRALLAHEPLRIEANHLLGLALYRQGKTNAARDILARVCAQPAVTAQMLSDYGDALNVLGEREQAASAFGRAIALQPDFAAAFHRLGMLHQSAGRKIAAIDAFRRAILLQPDFAEARNNLAGAYNNVIPPDRFTLMDDPRRFDAYEAAINRAVKGKRVLDIGTGAGVLAMLAVRAGAKSVVTCEGNAIVAHLARETLVANGVSGKVRLVAKAGGELTAGNDMTEPADVLIIEVLSNGLINEGLLPMLEYAHAHLLAPDASVIPAAASVMGYLAGGEALQGMVVVDKVKQLDLSLFNNFAPPVLGISLDGFPHDIYSGDFEMLHFDFRENNFPMATVQLSVKVMKSGACVGVVQWIKLQLDAETHYENRPAAEAGFNGHWTHVLYRFPEALQVVRGDVVHLSVRHDRNSIFIDLAGHAKA